MAQQTLTNLQRQVWEYGVEAAYSSVVMMEKIAHVVKLAGGKLGTPHNFPRLGRETAIIVGSDGSFTPVDVTVTTTQILITRDVVAPKDFVTSQFDISDPQTAKTFQRALGNAIATQLDVDALSNHASWTAASAVASAGSPVPLTEGNLAEGANNLDNVFAPKIGRVFICHPNNWRTLKSDPAIQQAIAFGSALAKNPMFRGVNPDGSVGFSLSGAEIWVSTNVPSSGGSRRNQMFIGKELGILMRTGVEFEKHSQLPNLVRRTLLIAMSLWGTGVINADSGLIIHNTP